MRWLSVAKTRQGKENKPSICEIPMVSLPWGIVWEEKMSLKFATRLAIFGVTTAFLIDMVQAWYINDLLLSMRGEGKITLKQLYFYSHQVTTIKSFLQNGSLGYFFYVMQFKLNMFGEYYQ